jgi:RNA polymerase sigma-70 factor (ECF subfamily)
VLDVNEPALRAEAGDGGGDFESFYRSTRRRVLALAYGLTGSPSAAEELTQEAFLAAFRRWDRIGQYDDPSAWVRRVVVNRSVSRVRRAVAEARAMARLGARPMSPIELEARDDEFWRAVRALPSRQAQVVVMHYVDDSSIDDIAAVLGIAPGTVKATLFQARRTLAVSLGCDPEDDE